MAASQSAVPVDVKELYAEATANLRFGKLQQWAVSHYLLIFYAALYWAHRLLREGAQSGSCKWIAAIDTVAILAAALAALAGCIFMYSILGFLQRQRQRLNGIYDGRVSDGFIAANVEKLWSGRVDDRFWRDKEIWLPLTIVQVGAALWLVLVIGLKFGQV